MIGLAVEVEVDAVVCCGVVSFRDEELEDGTADTASASRLPAEKPVRIASGSSRLALRSKSADGGGKEPNAAANLRRRREATRCSANGTQILSNNNAQRNSWRTRYNLLIHSTTEYSYAYY